MPAQDSGTAGETRARKTVNARISVSLDTPLLNDLEAALETLVQEIEDAALEHVTYTAIVASAAQITSIERVLVCIRDLRENAHDYLATAAGNDDAADRASCECCG